MTNRWQRSDAPRGDDYDARWRSLAAAGQNVHGEADLVEALLRESGGTSVLDAGCGTGRVAIELAERGLAVTGVDADPGMLGAARAKAPRLSWIEADLAGVQDALDRLAAEAVAALGAGPATVERLVDCRYAGQSHAIATRLRDTPARLYAAQHYLETLGRPRAATGKTMATSAG